LIKPDEQRSHTDEIPKADRLLLETVRRALLMIAGAIETVRRALLMIAGAIEKYLGRASDP
jgi:hypothetical protein